MANPAEFQKPGVLQVEYGYDSNFRAEDFCFQQSLPLNIRFAVHSRLLLEAEVETVTSRPEREGDDLQTGIGDTRLGFQVVTLKEAENRPRLAFAYNVKIPTASESTMLGTGRYAHRITVYLAKNSAKTQIWTLMALISTSDAKTVTDALTEV